MVQLLFPRGDLSPASFSGKGALENVADIPQSITAYVSVRVTALETSQINQSLQMTADRWSPGRVNSPSPNPVSLDRRLKKTNTLALIDW